MLLREKAVEGEERSQENSKNSGGGYGSHNPGSIRTLNKNSLEGMHFIFLNSP